MVEQKQRKQCFLRYGPESAARGRQGIWSLSLFILSPAGGVELCRLSDVADPGCIGVSLPGGEVSAVLHVFRGWECHNWTMQKYQDTDFQDYPTMLDWGKRIQS